MNYSTRKPFASALSVAFVATVAVTSASTAIAQRGHSDPMGSAMDCQRWLDGREERNMPPRCRELAGQLNQLRRATSAFHSADVARAAGWNTPLSPCVEGPMGGMGYHVAHPEELNNSTLAILRPEALLYVPSEDGSMEFLGVEYIVPAPLWEFHEPPQLMGQSFEFVAHQNIWALHAWIARPNPEGVFAAWNPDVSCEFGEDFPFPTPAAPAAE